MHEAFEPYRLALVAVAVLGVSNAIQGLISGGIKSAIEQQPTGQPAAGDVSRFSFRAVRTFLNGVENLPAFVAVAFAAVLLGADPFLTNAACVVVLLSRLVYWLIYYVGIDGDGFGFRSVAFFFLPAGTVFLGIVAII